MDFEKYRVEILGGTHFSKNSRLSSNGVNNTSAFRSVHPLNSFHLFNSSRKRSYNNDEYLNYVELRNGQHYRIKLTNNQAIRVQARVKIDGNYVGTWLIHSYDSIILERPVSIDKKFTFYKVGKAPIGSGISALNRKTNGLVEVEFTPEKKYNFHNHEEDILFIRDSCNNKNTYGDFFDVQSQSFENPRFKSNFQSHPELKNCMAGALDDQYCQGGTALKGKSYQKYRIANQLDLNHQGKVTISLRLVARKNTLDYNKVTPLSELKSRHNIDTPKRSPTPPPISNWHSDGDGGMQFFV